MRPTVIGQLGRFDGSLPSETETVDCGLATVPMYKLYPPRRLEMPQAVL